MIATWAAAGALIAAVVVLHAIYRTLLRLQRTHRELLELLARLERPVLRLQENVERIGTNLDPELRALNAAFLREMSASTANQHSNSADAERAVRARSEELR